jgi:hypothetical protein
MPPKKQPAGKDKEKDDAAGSGGKSKAGGTKVKMRHILCEKVRLKSPQVNEMLSQHQFLSSRHHLHGIFSLWRFILVNYSNFDLFVALEDNGSDAEAAGRSKLCGGRQDL